MPPKKVATTAPTPLSTTDDPKIITFPHGTIKRSAEEKLTAKYQMVAGVDEAGRGPLAGPVVAAACIIPLDVTIEGVNDSKKLDHQQREYLFKKITQHPRIIYSAQVIDHTTIDTINILQATMKGMTEAVDNLKIVPKSVLVDGNRVPPMLASKYHCEAVVGGDAKELVIAAASIIAKVTRDRLMDELDAKYPQYGFAQHKGYGVPAHVAAIYKYGPSEMHRKSFQPVKGMIMAKEKEKEKGTTNEKTKGKGKEEAKVGKVADEGKSTGRKNKVAAVESKLVVEVEIEEKGATGETKRGRGRPPKNTKASDSTQSITSVNADDGDDDDDNKSIGRKRKAREISQSDKGTINNSNGIDGKEGAKPRAKRLKKE